ncbi:diguanylate cyclase (GGDEF) domain-containing protein [Hoeflea sp. IMCC20628]|nr:diguanylate cyclase (GGDEF) domain-containing protein [Hoeflea sp. IMCC20628]
MIFPNLTYQWLGPTIIVTAGVAFLSLFFYDRKQLPALRLAGAYFFAAIGYTLIMLAEGDLPPAYRASIQLSLFTSHFLLIWGVASLYGVKFPRLAFGLTAGVAFGIIIYTYSDPSLFWLRFTATSGFVVLVDIFCGLLVWRARKYRVDMTIAAILIAQASLTFYRIIEINLSGPKPLTLDAFNGSQFASSMQTENAIFAVVIGVALFARYSVKLVTRLIRLAETDPLTGLLNRRAFETRVQRLRAASAPFPTGLILCDIDHFKRVNDTHGHDAGDVALKAVAQLLMDVSGETCVCARLGGEEFCIVLPEANEEMTRLAATRLRISVESQQIPSTGDDLRLTASFGYCVLAPGDDFGVAMAGVDAAVYQSKNDGRNRVRLAEAGKPDRALYVDQAEATG